VDLGFHIGCRFTIQGAMGNPGWRVEGPAVSFCPSDLTAPKKSYRPKLCHPERSRGTCSFTFGHSKYAMGELRLGSVLPTTNCRSLGFARDDKV
jgi:hypothetical protein